MKISDIKTNMQRLDNDIANYWKIIQAENIMSIKHTRMHDLKTVMIKLEQANKKLLKLKLALQCANMGYKSIAQLSANHNYGTIFELTMYNNMKVQLGYINTINSALKRKVGKKNMKTTEIFTSQYVQNKKQEYDIQIIALKEKLTAFNEQDFEIDLDDNIQAAA